LGQSQHDATFADARSDMIVDRRQLKDDLPKLLTLLQSQPLPTG